MSTHGASPAPARAAGRLTFWTTCAVLIAFGVWTVTLVARVSDLRGELEQRVGWLVGLQTTQQMLATTRWGRTRRPS